MAWEDELQKYVDQRKQTTQNTIDSTNAAIDRSAAASQAKVQKQIDALPQQYQQGYDTNALQQLVNQRQLQERMANLGLTDSGLNRTQETALAVTKGNADAKLTAQKQAAADALAQAITDLTLQAQQQKDTNAANLWNAANTDIANQRTSLYNADVSAQAQRYAAEQAAAQAQYEAQLKYQRQQAELAAENARARQSAQADVLKSMLSSGNIDSNTYTQVLKSLGISAPVASASSVGGTSATQSAANDPTAGATQMANIVKKGLSSGKFKTKTDAVNFIVGYYGNFPNADALIERAAKESGLSGYLVT